MTTPIEHDELRTRARAIIDANKYMTLATADDDGRPWVSPVYFTPDGYRDYYWVSSPDAAHSSNVEARPDVSVVIYDSSVPIGGAAAVYLRGRAGLVEGADLERCAALYSGRFPELTVFRPEDLTAPAPWRLYVVTAAVHSLLVRVGDPDHGSGADTR
ncbi:MAG: pyridoxamine 5'-phosphate oxidase family protein, partial [Mycobacteriales bacterium]